MLLAECPEKYHSTSGALLVGNPWVETVRLKGRRPFSQLPGAEEEVKMIGQIVNTEPLTGKKATKDQVLSRLNSVSLVHISTSQLMVVKKPVKLSCLLIFLVPKGAKRKTFF